jgi:hypothetical protein
MKYIVKKSKVTNTYVHGLYTQSGFQSPKFNVNIAEWSKIKINDPSVPLRTSRCPFLGPPIAPFYDLLPPHLRTS